MPDFSAGAMENWGLITFRETALLYNPTLGTIGNYERVVTTVAHELAHQVRSTIVNFLTLTYTFLTIIDHGYKEYRQFKIVAKSLLV